LSQFNFYNKIKNNFLLFNFQCLITAILYFQSLHFFIPHISIVFVLAFIQGGISGISYGGTLDRIHKKVFYN